MPDEQMLNQCINPLVSLATQFSIFLKGQVSQPPNPLSFSKRRDGMGLELIKFFAHGFAVITSNRVRTHAQRRNRTPVLFAGFVFCSLPDCVT
jgi:hypothetical protein